MKNNSYSPLALYALQQFAGLEKSAGKVELLFNSLSAANKNYPSAAEFREKMEIAKRTGIGKIAMDFTQNNTLDSPYCYLLWMAVI